MLVRLVVLFPGSLGSAATPDVVFTEEAAARGAALLTASGAGAGRGVALGDLDRDGDPDLVVLGVDGERVAVLANDGGGVFAEVAEPGIEAFPLASSVACGDLDGDGLPELFLGGWGAPDRLYRNDGGLRFTDVSASAGLLAENGRAAGSAFADVDGDGWLDLYVSNTTIEGWPVPNRLYRNRGDGTLEEIGRALGVAVAELTWQSVFLDYDRDGDLDLYVSDDKGYLCQATNHLFENRGGSFVDVTGPSGTAACIASMGIAVGDFDNDLWPDLYCTNLPFGNRLFLNQGDGTFVESSEISGTAAFQNGWAALFLDLDLDGWTDLYVCNEPSPNRLFTHDGSWPCVDIAPAAGVNVPGQSYSAAAADVDGDGDLDLAVQNANEPLRLFVAHPPAGRRWVRFDVVGRGANPAAVGARVEIDAGGRRQMREVHAGTGFKGQSELTLHFGLGPSSLQSIDVTWPGGATRRLTGYRADRRWRLLPPEALGDVDGDGDVDLRDLALLETHWTGSGPGRIEPGGEACDLDADGDVDATDRELLRRRILPAPVAPAVTPRPR